MSSQRLPEPVTASIVYVDRAVAEECRKVANAPKGRANETLHRAAAALGTMVGAGWLPRAEAEIQLHAAAAARGLPRAEASATIKSGLDWGEANPRQADRPMQTIREKPFTAEYARRLLSEARPIAGTLAESYLHARAIVNWRPDALRFSPSVKMPGGVAVPAMLAMIVVPTTGEFLGIQRTALAADGLRKAAIETKKASLGRTAGGAVVLGDLIGASTVLEGEGIETVLSACEATGLPGIATLSAGTLGKPQLPEGCAVIVLGDRGSEKAAEAGARRRYSEGRSVRIVYPPAGQGKDFNDFLTSEGGEAVKRAIDAAPAFLPGRALQSYSSRCLADIEPQPVRWLWPKRIALGKLSLIAGHPGRGKSTLTLYMAALVSNGGAWPDGSPCPKGNVAFITCEDDPADTLVPRLKAVGADLTRCHLLDFVNDDEDRERPFNLKTDAAKIEELARDKGGLSLIIIDPISAYLNGIDSHNVAEVRGALVPLQQIAERLSAAVVIVSHFNKGTPDGSAMSRVAGSGAFVAVCRSVWAVERDPENPDGEKRFFAPMKNNIGDDRTGFAFVVVHCDLGNGIGGSRVRFEPGGLLVNADELVRGQTASAGRRSALGEAKAFLSDLLADSTLPEIEIETAASRAGHKMRTVQRAKSELGIKSCKRAEGWWWELPRQTMGGPSLFDEQERQVRQECQVSERPDVGIHDCEEERVHSDHAQDCQAFEPERIGALGNVGNLESCFSQKRVT